MILIQRQLRYSDRVTEVFQQLIDSFDSHRPILNSPTPITRITQSAVLSLGNFLVQGVPAQKAVVLPLFDFFHLPFLIARCDVTGCRHIFIVRFGTFKDYNFSWHSILFKCCP